MAQSQAHTPPVADASEAFVCEVCGERFASRRELRAHGRSAGLID